MEPTTFTIKYQFDPKVKAKMDSLVVPDIYDQNGNIINFNRGVFGPDGNNHYSFYQISPYAINWIFSLLEKERNWWWLAGNDHPLIIDLCDKNLNKIDEIAVKNRNIVDYEDSTEKKNIAMEWFKLKNKDYFRNNPILSFYEHRIPEDIVESIMYKVKNIENDPKNDESVYQIASQLVVFDNLYPYEIQKNRRSLIFLLQNNKNLQKTFLQRIAVNRNIIKYLSQSPEVIEQILENPQWTAWIDWTYLSMNPHSKAIEMLKNNLDKVDWAEIDQNPSFDAFLTNQIPVFTRDFIEERNKELNKELTEYYYKPERLHRQANRLNISFEDLLNII